MASPFDSLNTSQMTVYPLSDVDVYGAPSYDSPVVVSCSYQSGGKTQRDQDGNEFVPMSTFWPVAGYEIKRGYRVAIGDTSATVAPDDAEAEPVRKVVVSDNPFGWDASTVVYTG